MILKLFASIGLIGGGWTSMGELFANNIKPEKTAANETWCMLAALSLCIGLWMLGDLIDKVISYFANRNKKVA